MGLFNACQKDLERVSEKANFVNLVRCYFSHRGFRAVVYYRLARYLMLKGIRYIIPSVLKARSITVTGAEIASEAEIGAGLVITHPVGVVIGSRVKIGENCTIMQGVTIGEKWSEKCGKKVPIIGNRVILGAGCRILGGVVIGDDVLVGANSVVISDIPSGKIAGGIPAHILR